LSRAGQRRKFTAFLGLHVIRPGERLSNIDVEAFKAMNSTTVKAYPDFKFIATTLRSLNLPLATIGARSAGRTKLFIIAVLFRFGILVGFEAGTVLRAGSFMA